MEPPVRVVAACLLGRHFVPRAPGINAGRVTGCKDVELPGVVGTVTIGILEVERPALGRVEPDVVTVSHDHNRHPFTIGGVIEPEPIIIAGNADATDPEAPWKDKVFVYRNAVTDQMVLVPRYGDTAAKSY